MIRAAVAVVVALAALQIGGVEWVGPLRTAVDATASALLDVLGVVGRAIDSARR